MTPRDRERLDVLLVERGLAPSRARAQALVLAGRVRVAGQPAAKPGDRVSRDADVAVEQDDGWASRGAYKLLGALDAFPWLRERIAGARCLDVGASTGGFTDVLLREGAAGVVAVDVGYGQLAWRLRQDPRVVVMDRTNVRHLAPGSLPWAPEVVTCDASFISVRLFLDVLWREMAPGGVLVVLVKPQFEVGRERVGKGGVVRDDAAREDALRGVREAAEAIGFRTFGHADSPLAGPRGNRELLLVLEKPAPA